MKLAGYVSILVREGLSHDALAARLASENNQKSENAEKLKASDFWLLPVNNAGNQPHTLIMLSGGLISWFSKLALIN